MTEHLELYKCEICGNIVEILNAGYGTLVCCSQPMQKLEEHKNDETAQEKHVPILTSNDHEKTIRVGSIPHPMEKEHYIVFIEAISQDQKYIKRKYLSPHEEPKMELKTKCHYSQFTARELCNIHGLWSAKYLDS